jgi:hypothetical protein
MCCLWSDLWIDSDFWTDGLNYWVFGARAHARTHTHTHTHSRVLFTTEGYFRQICSSFFSMTFRFLIYISIYIYRLYYFYDCLMYIVFVFLFSYMCIILYIFLVLCSTSTFYTEWCQKSLGTASLLLNMDCRVTFAPRCIFYISYAK